MGSVTVEDSAQKDRLTNHTPVRPNAEVLRAPPFAALLQRVFRVCIASWPDSDNADMLSATPAGSSTPAGPDAAGFSLAVKAPPAEDNALSKLSLAETALIYLHPYCQGNIGCPPDLTTKPPTAQ